MPRLVSPAVVVSAPPLIERVLLAPSVTLLADRASPAWIVTVAAAAGLIVTSSADVGWAPLLQLAATSQ